MLDPRTLWAYYRGRWRLEPIPEIFSILGIACGVALLFAVQVANRSVTGSFEQLAEGIAGKATLEVAARAPEGFDQRTFGRIARLPDVAMAAPVVERRISVNGPDGKAPLTLVGVDNRLPKLGGKLVAGLAKRTRGEPEIGIYLTEPTAKAVGARPGQQVRVEVGERRRVATVAGVLTEGEIGPLVHSPTTVVPLGYAQELVGLEGRLTRALVAPLPGRQAQAKAALERLSAGRLNVRSADSEARLLRQAASADRQSSALFAAVSLVIGVLLAYNAILLTLRERRQFVAGLHLQAAPKHVIVVMLFFELAIAGLAGSVLGLIGGELLSRFVLHQVPGFLASAFAIGSQRIVDPQTVVLALAVGPVAALAAGLQLVRELLKLGPLDAFSEPEPEADDKRSLRLKRRLLWIGVGVIATMIASSLLAPKRTFLGSVLLYDAGAVIALPALIAYLILASESRSKRTSSPILRVVTSELAGSPTRATALAVTGMLAVAATLGIAGPARDLKRGVSGVTGAFYDNAELWILPGGGGNTFLTQHFDHHRVARRIQSIAGVDSVRAFRGSFLDLGKRRVWVSAPPTTDRQLVSPSQLTLGDLETATQRLRRGGWVALTSTVANERGVKLGERFALPTPSGPQRFRLAATITNYGWPSGTIIANSRDYSRFWATRQASALEVDVAGAASVEAVQTRIASSLRKTGLGAYTAEERRADLAEVTNQGLARLDQISTMVLVTVTLAIAAAMLGAGWERRRRVWDLVSMGMTSGQLYRIFLLEIGAVLLFGVAVGIAVGFVGQALGGRWLAETTAFPVPFIPAWGLAARSLVAIVVLGLIATALPVRLLFPIRRTAVFSPE